MNKFYELGLEAAEATNLSFDLATTLSNEIEIIETTDLSGLPKSVQVIVYEALQRMIDRRDGVESDFAAGVRITGYFLDKAEPLTNSINLEFDIYKNRYIS